MNFLEFLEFLEIQRIQGSQGIQVEFSVWSTHLGVLCVSLRSTHSWVVSNSVSSSLMVEFPGIPWISLNSWKFKEFSVWSTHIGLLCVSLRSTLSWIVSNSVSSSLIVEFLEFLEFPISGWWALLKNSNFKLFLICILTITPSFLNEIQKVFLRKWSVKKAIQSLTEENFSQHFVFNFWWK